MYQSLSQRMDRVVKIANQVAREQELEYVGTEHVLMAIHREGTGLGVQILNELGADEKRVQTEIDQRMKARMEDTWVFGRLPGSPHFRNVIAKAIEEAEVMKSREVCTEHLILALLREKGSVGYEVLKAIGLNVRDVRTRIHDNASPSAE